MRILVVAGALSLAGCGQPTYGVSSRDLADDADANARSALSQIENLQSKVEQLESDNQRLKGRVDELESQAAGLKAGFDAHLKWSDSLAEKHNTLSNDFWRYQKWNEQRFGSLGRPWESL